jgi:hypothetical protein
MSFVSPYRSRARALLLWAAPLTWLGCGGGGTDVVLPSLSVSTSTQGIELDPDGYNLVIDGSQTQPVGLAATLVVERLSDGDHTVELAGLASNCSAEGDNPRTVTTRSGATTSTAFAVTCGPTSGSIEIGATVTGTGSDPDGFEVLLDNVSRGPISPNATASLSGITPGVHTLGLTGLAGNCEVAGENPRPVTVTAGQTAPVSFGVTCVTPGPGSGTLTITTTTGGSDQDADGYSVSLDGGSSQPIGINTTLTLPNLSSSSHQLELLGVALNCTLAGANPRSVTVSAGQTATVNFSVTCRAPTPGGGTLEITTTTGGTDPDPDGYTVRVDDGTPQPIGPVATLAIANVSAAEHRVRLLDIADNCTVPSNPIRVVVPSGGVGRAAFAITCTPLAPSTGSARITVATSGADQDPDGYNFTIDGAGAQTIPINGSRTVDGLTPGPHSIQLGGVAANCTVGGENPRSVTIVADQIQPAAFTVTCAASGPSVNLRVERMYLTQSTQRMNGDVPLVQGRDGWLRVFVTASGRNDVGPEVRVQFYEAGSSSPTRTLSIPASAGSTPTAVQEGNLGSSWNVRIPGSFIQPNTRVLVVADPTNAIAETNENDNTYPASGTPQQLTVRAVPPARIRFVSVIQGSSGPGNVSNANKDQLTDQLRRMFPLDAVQTDVRSSAYTASTELQSNGGGWNQVLSEIEALRVIEDPDRTFYGVVKLGYAFGVVGNGFVGLPSAIGTDNPADARRVLAHELGHTWGRWHSPCGNPGGLDPSEPYPYGSGQIGVYGLDVIAGRLRPPADPDIMGYCSDPWISDYTYEKVLSFRQSGALTTSAASASRQPSLLVWGHIANGQAVLEPAFQIVARPAVPARPGPYSLEAASNDGTRLFALSFDAAPAADGPEGTRHFAFVVPLDAARADRLWSVRLNGPGIQVAAVAPAAVGLQRATPDPMVQREGNVARLMWNAAAHPMIMVRDPDTAEILSFARGGDARIWTAKSELDLVTSDGVRSHRLRRAISR